MMLFGFIVVSLFFDCILFVCSCVRIFLIILCDMNECPLAWLGQEGSLI